MSKLRPRLTYANVMSSLAVFLVLGAGGAWAAKKATQKIGATQIKSSAITTAKIKNEAVDTAKLKGGAVSTEKLAEGSVINSKLAAGAVGTANLASGAVTGEKVDEATLSEVPSANSANPVLFAHVNSNGVVDAANSKGITSPNVSHPATGVYCISVSAFTPRGGQVTPQASGPSTTAQLSVGGGSDCAAPTVQVSTWSVGATPAASDTGFFVELYH